MGNAWKRYKNGNYTVSINTNDGTKIRRTEEDDFIAEFAESFDCKITNQCDMGCVMCHENSTKDGLHGDILNQEFINTLKPYTEIAIGGGNPLSHPDLIKFLEKLKERKVIASMTVNQYHFIKDIELLRKLVDEKLIYGLGVSLMKAEVNFIELIKQFGNAVLHVINGMVSEQDIEILKDNNLKILILGYKTFRRGKDNYENNSEFIKFNKSWIANNLENILRMFKVVSFDNLAIEQLKVSSIVTGEDWERFYMGDDGTKTFYIDMVEQKFASCSTAEKRYNLMEDMQDMFRVIVNQ